KATKASKAASPRRSRKRQRRHAEHTETPRDGPAKRAAPRESLAQNTTHAFMGFVFSRGFPVAHAGRLRRPPVALGEATVFFRVLRVLRVFRGSQNSCVIEA